jgi:hypothetical protein
MKPVLHFKTRATKTLESGTFANMALAQAWCVVKIASYVRALRIEMIDGTVYVSESGMSVSTDGGDEIEAACNWVSDAPNAQVYAEIRARDF